MTELRAYLDSMRHVLASGGDDHLVAALAQVAGDKSISPSARVAAASKLADLAIPRQSSVELSGPSGGALRIDIGPDTPDDVLERLAAAED